ncbi:glycosyltransferase [Candidatus Parcubacteria bacterium]|nr:MAG: glycosyltransferase [Candidatus Parcubacteria bacterium]
MKKSPIVSVIIPTFNRANLIVRAIDSVLNGQYANTELIIVDDGSTDNTAEIIKKKYFGQSIKYFFQQNKGPSTAKNLGIKQSKGKYVCFLDSDDYYDKKNINTKVEVLENNQELGWVFSDCFNIVENDPSSRTHIVPRKLVERLSSSNYFFDLYLTIGGFIRTHTVLIRRECFSLLQGFDEELPSYEDILFFLKLSKSFKAKYIHEPLSFGVVQYSGNISSSKARYYSTFSFIQKVKDNFPDDVIRLNWPPRMSRWIADTYNYFGMEHYKIQKNREAIIDFIRSIKTYPFQRRVYYLLLKSLLKYAF